MASTSSFPNSRTGSNTIRSDGDYHNNSTDSNERSRIQSDEGRNSKLTFSKITGATKYHDIRTIHCKKKKQVKNIKRENTSNFPKDSTFTKISGTTIYHKINSSFSETKRLDRFLKNFAEAGLKKLARAFLVVNIIDIWAYKNKSGSEEDYKKALAWFKGECNFIISRDFVEDLLQTDVDAIYYNITNLTEEEVTKLRNGAL